jgi:hypothetical protein
MARPLPNVVADPNPNLKVPAFQAAVGRMGGHCAQTRWRPATGCGVGSGTLLDIGGEIGRVSMSVVLIPSRKTCGGCKISHSRPFPPSRPWRGSRV